MGDQDGKVGVGLHTPMQRQLRAYPYAYTLLPLYYISTSLRAIGHHGRPSLERYLLVAHWFNPPLLFMLINL